LEALVNRHRTLVAEELGRLAELHYPALLREGQPEFRKMVELSTKMTMAANACSSIAGLPFDQSRQVLGALYGGCCFLADSFIDDYGERVAADYLARFDTFLTRGWFEVRNDRERLFYVIAARLFARRDLLDPMLRQAIYWLFLAQQRDVLLRINAPAFRALPAANRLALLQRCARDRGGHTLLLLAHLVAPGLPLSCQAPLFAGGALFMFIDDHGDCYADRQSHRVTYLNQVPHPAAELRRLVTATLRRLRAQLPASDGRALLCAFLRRYFVTRLQKHEEQRRAGGLSWAVYE
jgi:hypothetical protein